MWTSEPCGPPIARRGAPAVTEGLAALARLIRRRPPSPRCLRLARGRAGSVRASGRLLTGILVAPILVGLLLAGCGGAGPSESETPEPATEPAPAEAASPEPTNVGDIFPEGLGRQLVLDTCGACHAIACSAIGQRTAARWNNLKEDHRDKVPSLSEEELETLFAYLNEHFSDSKPEPRVPPHFLEGGCTPF